MENGRSKYPCLQSDSEWNSLSCWFEFYNWKCCTPVREAVPSGEELTYLDAGYDDNDTIRVMFKKGYAPIVCPNKNRWEGCWRKKARKLYRMRKHKLGYRQRGRGESLFGSLTNQFGEGLNVRNEIAMRTLMATRIFCYQTKLLVRCNSMVFVLIIRHAPYCCNVKKLDILRVWS